MPPMKNKRKKFCRAKKQLKKVEARLMEISFKIENYIYKNRSISLHDAALCIKEVSSYKYQYGKDPRILQVAEKLIRQLKGVIEEQDPTYSWNVQEVIENSIAVALSPTYSEREIDVVEHDPICDDNEVDGNEIRKGGKEDHAIVIDLTLDDPIAKENGAIAIDSYENNTNKRMDDRINRNSVNLSNEGNINESNILVTKSQIHVCNSPIKEIQKSLSQLAIETVNEEKQTSISLRSVRKISHGSKFCNRIITNDDMLQNSTVGRNGQYLDTTVKNAQNEASNNFVTTKSTLHDQTICKPKQVEDTTPQIQPKKRRGSKKTVAKQIALNDGAKARSKRKWNKKTLKTQQNNEITVVQNKNMEPKCLKKDKILKNSIISMPLNVKRDPLKYVYNNHVVNDLSWVENIRYVREVAPDEIDHKLQYYNDSFWDTFDLPANWNDQDFLY